MPFVLLIHVFVDVERERERESLSLLTAVAKYIYHSFFPERSLVGCSILLCGQFDRLIGGGNYHLFGFVSQQERTKSPKL
jgi:hypothetical protein